ncbi:MAG: ParB/RepB/Spo0J family partition protein [Oscillospiraceae bacterium]|nr:ParB/RepB/Spo0J family partition protein [Oscillospiraceae bacterium]
MAKGGLGSGLDFLFDDNAADVQVKKTVRMSEIEPNRKQPRKNFSEESIAALADSIQQYGILQPILVRPNGNGYQIVAGERRWRAARMLGLDEVPVIIKELSDLETMQIALIENLQRENLNPIEEAMGYRDLMEQFGMTQESVSKTVGRSRSTVANALRLLQLEDEILELLEKGQITAGHAKALLSINGSELRVSTAKKAARGMLTVRAIERIAAEEAEVKPEPFEMDPGTDSYFREVEISLSEVLKRHVSVKYSGNKGSLTLDFYDKDDLNELCKAFTW